MGARKWLAGRMRVGVWRFAVVAARVIRAVEGEGITRPPSRAS